MPVDFQFAARSDVGLVRKNNQDSGYAGSHLLVLCDGMGGAAGGDIASSIAVAHMAVLDDGHRAEEMLPALRRALVDAHDELVDRSRRDPDLKGLGTTCIALMRSGTQLAMVHIGDSRAYLLRNGELTQVTTDHSFVQYLIDTGQITAEEAETHPQRSVVLRVLGDSGMDTEPDESIREAVEGDRWLLCSDGLSGVVSADTLLDVLTDIDDPGECADRLIDLALQGGGPDNITCVVADVVSTTEHHSQQPQIVGAAAVDRARPSRGGGSAAARAAALTPTEVVDDEDDDSTHERRWHWVPWTSLVVLVAVILAGWASYVWSQTQYYAQTEDDQVVIFQGIPQSIGSWKLSHPVEITGIAVSDLTPVERERLSSPVRRDSREEIDAYIEGLRRSIALQHAAGGAPSDSQSTPGEEGDSTPTSPTTPTSTPSSSSGGA